MNVIKWRCPRCGWFGLDDFYGDDNNIIFDSPYENWAIESCKRCFEETETYIHLEIIDDDEDK